MKLDNIWNAGYVFHLHGERRLRDAVVRGATICEETEAGTHSLNVASARTRHTCQPGETLDGQAECTSRRGCRMKDGGEGLLGVVEFPVLSVFGEIGSARTPFLSVASSGRGSASPNPPAPSYACPSLVPLLFRYAPFIATTKAHVLPSIFCSFLRFLFCVPLFSSFPASLLFIAFLQKSYKLVRYSRKRSVCVIFIWPVAIIAFLLTRSKLYRISRMGDPAGFGG